MDLEASGEEIFSGQGGKPPILLRRNYTSKGKSYERNVTKALK